MDFKLFFVILFGMQLLCLAVGYLSSKVLRNQKDYFLAGESVSFFPLMMAFIATQVGGGFILGASDEAYKFGLGYPFLPARRFDRHDPGRLWLRETDPPL